MTEGRKSNNSKSRDNDDDDESNNDKKDITTTNVPWYRRGIIGRYATLNLSPTVTKKMILKDNDDDASTTTTTTTTDDDENNKKLFYGQCLQRQLWKPPVPYPAWDFNWDGKMLDDFSTLEVLSTPKGLQQSHSTGTTRHIILIRHGQYEEQYYDDRKRCLTPLGRRQARLTGKRMAEIIQAIGINRINAIYTSDLLRAKQTAWIMMKSFPDSLLQQQQKQRDNNKKKKNDSSSTTTTTTTTTKTTLLRPPDSDLNEALPAPIVPPRPDLPGIEEEVDENTTRMERAFQRYFYRADPSPELLTALVELRRQKQKLVDKQQQQQSANTIRSHEEEDLEYNISTSGTVSMMSRSINNKNNEALTNSSNNNNKPPLLLSSILNNNNNNILHELPPPDHKFDIIVCHGNIIRYFACRALQLPPEAWLRLSVFNCSITYLMIKPNGYVSCRMIGDIGHLGYNETTFSGAHGLVWS